MLQSFQVIYRVSFLFDKLSPTKPSHAVVAGCGAVIDGGWEDIKFNRLVINHLVEFVVVIQK